MASVGVDIARDILLRLPTRDLASCSCVCKLWRDVIGDPDFRTLHADAVSSCSGETLLVSEFHGRSMGSELTVLSATSGTPIRRLAQLPAGYSPANACNGFLLLASAALDLPVCVCNPVTGDTLWIPPPPENKHVERCTYAMGFSEPTRVYKLFRLSFPGTGWPRINDCYLDVYTLGAGGDGGWRQHPHLFRAEYNVHTPPPVLLDGKLYVVIERPENYRAPDTMLVIDVASEAHSTYSLPEVFLGADGAVVQAFELSGKLCVAIRATGRRRVNFWVLLSLETRLRWWSPDWERRCTFYLDADGVYGEQPWGDTDTPSCAWLDGGDDGMLCYRLGDSLYKYDVNTTKKKRQKRQIQLPPTPCAPPDVQRWNVYGGYRPSLLSPHIAFTTSDSESLLPHREKQEQFEALWGNFEQTLLHAVRSQPSSKKRYCSNNHHHGAKRIRKPTR